MKRWMAGTPDLVFMGILTLPYMAFVALLVQVGANDIRMTNVFSIDESDIVAHIWNLYLTHFGTPPSFKYGGAFYMVPVATLHAWSLFFDVSEKTAIISVRMMCGLAGVGCLWMTYLLGKSLHNGVVGVLAAFLLGANSTFLRWSVESHPDLPQLFFLLLSLYFLCRYVSRPKGHLLVLASLGAGMALAIKYAGIFMIPVAILAIYASFGPLTFSARITSARFWTHCALLVCVFFAIFLAMNPSVLTHLTEFRDSIQGEKKIMAFGHRLRDVTGSWVWLQMLVSQVGTAHALIALGGGFLWLLRYRKRISADHVMMLAWAGVFLFYLMAESSLIRPRHLLPILPVVLLYVGAGYELLWRALLKHLSIHRKLDFVLLGLVLVLNGSQICLSADMIDTRWRRESNRVEIEAGRWLAETYPANTRILFDAYAYVPRKFQFVFRSIGMDYLEVNHFEPDLLVVRDAIASDYSNLEEAKSARMGELQFSDRHYFYEFLKAGKMNTYRLKRGFGSLAIYERTVPKMRENEDLKALWIQLLSDYLKMRRYGAVEALWTMGYIHLVDGHSEMAAQEFGRARNSQTFTKRIYGHGVRLLKWGMTDEARHALDAALSSSETETESFQARMREDLAYRFFEAGLYTDMLETATEASRLDSTLSAASFEVAVGHLALGHLDDGIAAFQNAVGRFGRHDKGKILLGLLLARNISSQAVTRLTETYYSSNSDSSP
ncbi:MAG: glycosyltransferase family 39 protein [bacterium]|nr:glycosyltransferase family 39 protein [bacterium]